MYTMESTPPDTSLGKVLATDRDEGTNSQIFYSIAGGNSLGKLKKHACLFNVSSAIMNTLSIPSPVHCGVAFYTFSKTMWSIYTKLKYLVQGDLKKIN
jgi:hypothetical protein